MSLAGGTPPSSASKLRALLGAGYPILLHLPAGMPWLPMNSERETSGATPPFTEIGHSVLCIGYDLQNPADPLANAFEFHDPWHGPNVWVTEAALFGTGWAGVVPEQEPLSSPTAWYSAGGPYTWGAPWSAAPLTTGTLQSAPFNVQPNVTYTDALLQAIGAAAIPSRSLMFFPPARRNSRGPARLRSGAERILKTCR